MPVLVMKDWLVTYDADGNVDSVVDISNPGSPPRPRHIVIRATTMAKAVLAAKPLYSVSQ